MEEILLFTPIFKNVIWGADTLPKRKGISPAEGSKDGCGVGESWEISAVAGSESVVCNGTFQGRTLPSLLKEYGSSLAGCSVYEKFGDEFPLLIKFIDAGADLSIQVHPDDTLARERGKQYGKTEMWYVLESKEDASLISGFSKPCKKEEYASIVNDGSLTSYLGKYPVHPGDTFFIPAGRVHAIGAGCLLAEIQQSSDITYRLYDYGRLGADGKHRQLHVAEALDAIDFSIVSDATTSYSRNEPHAELVHSQYFNTDLRIVTEPLKLDLFDRDSFTILINVEGSVEINLNGIPTIMPPFSSALVPAAVESLEIKALDGKARLLEVYMEL